MDTNKMAQPGLQGSPIWEDGLDRWVQYHDLGVAFGKTAEHARQTALDMCDPRKQEK